MSSLVPRLPPSFSSLAIRTANNGGAWGMRLNIVISDSAYELSYICALTLLSMPLAAFIPVKNGYASSKVN